ncbi:hypothetical protein DAPPUDRAFT_235437 [Daphnia pulex]|uniref:Uncharacterized protein n=1 Tax=Daphnia pulex TaxID=6669 RepID=E9FYZ5_DAPPU|nr:hypothetical protein DAPPUDRAFT_235437 [Daphnia pulex]|eukprot:EFX87684.1 hypothetical protein DAPPUDRAFT_235437 [Daphnia pulex]
MPVFIKCYTICVSWVPAMVRYRLAQLDAATWCRSTENPPLVAWVSETIAPVVYFTTIRRCISRWTYSGDDDGDEGNNSEWKFVSAFFVVRSPRPVFLLILCAATPLRHNRSVTLDAGEATFEEGGKSLVVPYYPDHQSQLIGTHRLTDSLCAWLGSLLAARKSKKFDFSLLNSIRERLGKDRVSSESTPCDSALASRRLLDKQNEEEKGQKVKYPCRRLCAISANFHPPTRTTTLTFLVQEAEAAAAACQHNQVARVRRRAGAPSGPAGTLRGFDMAVSEESQKVVGLPALFENALSKWLKMRIQYWTTTFLANILHKSLLRANSPFDGGGSLLGSYDYASRINRLRSLSILFYYFAMTIKKSTAIYERREKKGAVVTRDVYNAFRLSYGSCNLPLSLAMTTPTSDLTSSSSSSGLGSTCTTAESPTETVLRLLRLASLSTSGRLGPEKTQLHNIYDTQCSRSTSQRELSLFPELKSITCHNLKRRCPNDIQCRDRPVLKLLPVPPINDSSGWSQVGLAKAIDDARHTHARQSHHTISTFSIGVGSQKLLYGPLFGVFLYEGGGRCLRRTTSVSPPPSSDRSAAKPRKGKNLCRVSNKCLIHRYYTYNIKPGVVVLCFPLTWLCKER